MRHRVFPFCYSTSYASSPVAPWLDEFSTWHTVTGYSRAALRSHMCVVRRVLEAHSVVAITTHFSDADLKHLFATRVRRAQFAAALYAFTRFLRDRGQWIDTPLRCRHADLIHAYELYLRDIRGLAPSTVLMQLTVVREFLNAHCRASREVADMRSHDVERFIAAKSKRNGRGSMQMVVGALRSFFRYCYQRGLLVERLDEIDLPTRFGHERPPRAVPWELAQKLLASIDRHNRMGCRDHAILYLMTHFGLRTGEVTYLSLKDVDLKGRLLSRDNLDGRLASIKMTRDYAAFGSCFS